MSIQVLQRAVWDGRPINQADFIRLRKQKDGCELEAIVELWTHRFGWHLEVNGGDFQLSQECRTQHEVLDAVEHWKAALLEKGWR